MKHIALISVLFLATLSYADKEKSGGWSDIKSGTMQVIREASKGIKKAERQAKKKK